MIVILKRDVKGTGKAGEVVKVSDGYARNMLLPRGYAEEATEGNVKNLEKQKALQARKRAEEKAAAEALAESFEDIKLEIKTKAGDGGRLFGSITNKDVAEALEKQQNIKLDKKKISLDNSIKQIGSFTATVKLHQDVNGKLTIVVSEEA